MIEVNNLTTTLINGKFLKKIAGKVLEKERKKKIALSIVLVGKEKIKKLNKKYLKRNRATDVLAFSSQEKFPILSEKEPELGEIVICPAEVKKNARRFSEKFERELARVLIHGILHLLEYDHEKNNKKAEIMKKKENYYLSRI